MHNIKVLDCTLRDGGYVNNWSFGQENAQKIIFGLQKAKLDFIEIGFIGKKETNSAQTLFNDFEKINAFLPKNYNKNSLLAMIAYGTFPLEKIPKIEASSIGGIRVIFKKDKKEEGEKRKAGRPKKVEEESDGPQSIEDLFEEESSEVDYFAKKKKNKKDDSSSNELKDIDEQIAKENQKLFENQEELDKQLNETLSQLDGENN